MNYQIHFALLLTSSIALTSCIGQETRAPLSATNNVIYLHNLINKTENAVTKFNALVAQGNVVVDFYADWCNPCTALSTVINQLAPQFSSVTFLKVNTDMFPALSSSIRSIPTIIFYKNGQQLYRQSGSLSASQMRSLLKKLF